MAHGCLSPRDDHMGLPSPVDGSCYQILFGYCGVSSWKVFGFMIASFGGIPHVTFSEGSSHSLFISLWTHGLGRRLALWSRDLEVEKSSGLNGAWSDKIVNLSICFMSWMSSCL